MPTTADRTDTTVTIGEAARRTGCAPSALRYYERRGLVCPGEDTAGRRTYTGGDLRRLAFVRLAQGLGLSLDDVGALLESEGDAWRRLLDGQVAALDRRIADLRAARELLARSRDCPADRPLRDCEYLRGGLDALLDGAEGGLPALLAAGPAAATDGRVSEVTADSGHRPAARGVEQPCDST